MSNLAYFVLLHDEARRRAAAYCDAAPDGTVAKFSDPVRTLEQNDKMWAMLTDISQQVLWPVDGVERLLPPQDWKHIISAGARQAQRIAQGVDGGFVVLGVSTSRMRKKDMIALIELAQFFGDSKGVIWGAKETKSIIPEYAR